MTSLLSRLLHPDPTQRITPEQALQSEWVCGAAPTWPREYLGTNRPSRLDEPGGRSWTILMRVPEAHLRALPSASADSGEGGGAREGDAAGSVPGPPGSIQQQPSQPPPPASLDSSLEAAAVAAAAAMGSGAVGGGAPPQGAMSAQGATSALGAGSAGLTVQQAGLGAVPDFSIGSPGKRKREEDEARSKSAAAAAQQQLLAAGGLPAGGVCGVGSVGGLSSIQEMGAQPRVASRSDSSRSSVDQGSQLSLNSVSELAPPGQGAASSSAAPAGSAADAAAAAASGAQLGALPLRGCVSEYVQRWGWAPLPQGTEQMLRDILQTLYGHPRPTPCHRAPSP